MKGVIAVLVAVRVFTYVRCNTVHVEITGATLNVEPRSSVASAFRPFP